MKPDTSWRRRARTIPRTILFALVLWAAWPLWLVIALLVDTARFVRSRVPFVTTRLLVFGMFYGAAEIVGMLLLLGVWLVALRNPAKLIELTYRVQQTWATALFRAACSIFDLRFEVAGDACVVPGPVVVFMQHASLIDTLLPTVFITKPHGLRLRFVLKRELLALPCLDIAGNRLPNYFVRRGGDESTSEIENVRRLAVALSPREGVLIYPEGTRFTRDKLARSLARLKQVDAARFARVAGYQRALPVRRGGSLAVLAGAADADLVIAAHAGLEGFAELPDIWRGGFVGRRAKVVLWRIARRDIPADEDACLAFLDSEWAKADQFARNEGAQS